MGYGQCPGPESEVCYACRFKNRRIRFCAAREALVSHSEQSRLEYFEPDLAQVTTR